MLYIVRQSSAEEYLASFWMRQQRKNGEFPPSDKRLETILGKYPYKFPCDGKREVAWHICQVSSKSELEQLWMHKSGDWLQKHGLWHDSHWLRDLAETAIETNFFVSNRDTGSCGINFHAWKDSVAGLKGRLDNDERPLLVQYPYFIDIVDGFGRLLPYLALVNVGKEFHPFEAYLAIPE